MCLAQRELFAADEWRERDALLDHWADGLVLISDRWQKDAVPALQRGGGDADMDSDDNHSSASTRTSTPCSSRRSPSSCSSRDDDSSLCSSVSRASAAPNAAGVDAFMRNYEARASPAFKWPPVGEGEARRRRPHRRRTHESRDGDRRQEERIVPQLGSVRLRFPLPGREPGVRRAVLHSLLDPRDRSRGLVATRRVPGRG